MQEEIIKGFFNRERYWYAVIHRQVGQKLNPGGNYKDFKEIFDEVPNLFMDWFQILSDNYIYTGKVETLHQAETVFHEIIRRHRYRFIKEYIDRKWFERLSPQEKRMNLKPPSYYWNKKYFLEHKERINELRRENYKNNKNGLRDKDRARRKKRNRRTIQNTEDIKKSHPLTWHIHKP